MKKLLSLALMLMLGFSCSKDRTEQITSDEQFGSERNCASHEVYLDQISKDPVFAAKQAELDRFTETYSKASHDRAINEIQVVVNVLYKTAAQNISLAQIQSQIDVLNADFAATNSDYGLTPALFVPALSGDTEVRFVLETVNRKSTNKTSWTSNNAIKKTSQGGLDPTSPTTKLNIWVGNLGSGLLGYAQFPGGPAATDGVVIDDNATGNTGTAAAPYGKGRTATHEVGHWLNLRHIWGDATCGSDLVSDTPTHNTSNSGCPSYPHLSTCAGTPVEMTMNYMDYTYDQCMYMFSDGQKARMQACLASTRAAY
jgi:Pregnancy-associated plasma protein-A